jgi:hypothetical protein
VCVNRLKQISAGAHCLCVGLLGTPLRGVAGQVSLAAQLTPSPPHVSGTNHEQNSLNYEAARCNAHYLLVFRY